MKHKDNIVFVVDMINGFINEGALADSSINQITQNIIPLLKENDSIFICDHHLEDAIEFRSFPPHCLKDSSESEVIDELKPFVKKIIKKNSTNAFHCLDLELLDSYQNIIITGCCSDICILQFALTLKTYFNQNDIDKNIIIYENCIATYDSEIHNAKEYHDFAVKLMENSGIIIERE